MKVHVLTRRLVVPLEREGVFAFFENAHNLGRLTPPEMQFRIITPVPIVMRVGALIDYVIRIGGLSVRWTTLITQYDPPLEFVDVQLMGPYAYWHHHHQFAAVEGGTEISDAVHYALPGGFLGTLMHSLFVRRRLQRIFDHRAAVMLDCLAGQVRKATE